MSSPEELLSFWFGQAGQPRMELWFGRSAQLDQQLQERFGQTLEQASRGELDAWAEQGPRGRLALVVLLDQLSRNLRRGTAAMFENDPRAKALAKDALCLGDDQALGVLEAAFLYLPLEHSESLEDQEESVARFERLHQRAPAELRHVTAGFLHYARLHHAPISRFGRFPHRNALLGRETTPAEAEFLAGPDASF